MILVTRCETKTTEIPLSPKEARRVALEYIEKVLIGNDCYVTDAGRIEHWTSCPHGSGTTTDKGEATLEQIAGWNFLHLAKIEDVDL